MARVTLVVSGKRFSTYWKTLARLPKTRLGQLTTSSPEYDADRKEFFFDRDPKVMESIITFYRTGELHVPSSACGIAVRNELEFWGIPEEMVSDCCWAKYSEQGDQQEIIGILDKAVGGTEPSGGELTCRGKIWTIMEKPFSSTAAKIWNVVYLIFVLTAIVNFSLSTVSSLRVTRKLAAVEEDFVRSHHTIRSLLESDIHPVMYYIDLVCISFFTLELPLRFIVCPNKVKFFKSFLNWVDILLIFIMWGAYAMDVIHSTGDYTTSLTILTIVLRALLSLRVLRIFHVARKFNSMKVLFLTFKSSVKEILMLLCVLTIAINIFGTVIYFAEILAEKNTFENIPIALWWAVITLTTVGYGDFYPSSPPGYVVGVFCSLVGIVTLSMPIAIIATNFSSYYSCLPSQKHRHQRRKFIRDNSEMVGNMMTENGTKAPKEVGDPLKAINDKRSDVTQTKL